MPESLHVQLPLVTITQRSMVFVCFRWYLWVSQRAFVVVPYTVRYKCCCLCIKLKNCGVHRVSRFSVKAITRSSESFLANPSSVLLRIARITVSFKVWRLPSGFVGCHPVLPNRRPEAAPCCNQGSNYLIRTRNSRINSKRVYNYIHIISTSTRFDPKRCSKCLGKTLMNFCRFSH